MHNFSLMGAGRIGKMHAANITLNPKCNLSYVYDVNNTINDIDCITNSNTKVTSKNIYNTINREKLLQSANNA